MSEITFGKFKGQLLSEVSDLGYIKWGAENFKGEWKEKFQEELNRRSVDKQKEERIDVNLPPSTFEMVKSSMERATSRELEVGTQGLNNGEFFEIPENWNSLLSNKHSGTTFDSFLKEQNIEVSGKTHSQQKYDSLIFGKDQTENVVSIEVDDEGLLLFIERDGKVTTERREYKPWILLNRSVESPKCSKLLGQQHFKYKLTLDNPENWKEAKQKLYKKNADFYCINDLKSQAMISEGITYYKGMKIKDVSVLSFDIETNGFKHNKDSIIYTIGNTFRDSLGNITRKLFSVDEYDSCIEMVEDWCLWVRTVNPSLMVGHNLYMFDYPFLNYIFKRDRSTTLPLGRDGSDVIVSNYESKKRKDGSQEYAFHDCKIYGRETVDTFFLALMADATERKYVSYGLKQIIKQEGLEKQDRTFIDASKISELWKDPVTRQQIKDYNIDDSDDALKLFDLKGPAFFYFTQNIPKSIQSIVNSATGSWINSILVRSYFQKGYSIPKATEKEEFVGAISFGIPGRYEHVFSVDFSALYPSIIREFKVFDKNKDPEGNFLKMMEYFTLQRLENKKLHKQTGNQYYKDLSDTQKIGGNSGYGFMGGTGLNFNSPENASFITKKGRELLNTICSIATGKDTDFWKNLNKEVEEDNV